MTQTFRYRREGAAITRALLDVRKQQAQRALLRAHCRKMDGLGLDTSAFGAALDTSGLDALEARLLVQLRQLSSEKAPFVYHAPVGDA